MAGKILVVGSLHLDVIVNSSRLPQPDETLLGDKVSYRFGGKGGNQAIAAAKISVQVLMACLLYTSPSPRDGLLSRMPSSA